MISKRADRKRMSGSGVHKIVFASHSSAASGGELALARYLKSSQLMDVELVTLAPGEIWDDVEARGVSVVVPRLMRRCRSQILDMIAFRRYLAENRGALIVSNSMRMALLVSLFRSRHHSHVYWVRDGLVQGSTSSFAQYLTRIFTLNRVDACIANSDWTRGTILDLKPDMRVDVVPSPSGLVPFGQATKWRATHPVARDGAPLRLLYLGRLSEWKGVHVAIEAVNKINAKAAGVVATLDIAGAAQFGENEYENRIRAAVRDTHGVRMLGHVRDPQSWITDYDGLLHCSLKPEPFGQVVVQAMSGGLVTFASNHGGPREVITHLKNGVLVAPGDPEALACQVSETFGDVLTARRISARAIVRAQDFSDDVIVRELDRVLKLRREQLLRD
ncbi:glycosyltransferase family 4 protein [Rhodococcus pyridinivorans]|uniref:glycosyltransferase family 4 protein n=1 Tax=Rhodococcus pyridinivorans TaxID=103816 RepID=UPI00216457FD|nr:glycosyltransferase family 4 protein [Rhodococcus pyridinivorans]UVT24117.1 glycosyltransferase family 4 protein [Rhodococcus pyridinivorans]